MLAKIKSILILWILPSCSVDGRRSQAAAGQRLGEQRVALLQDQAMLEMEMPVCRPIQLDKFQLHNSGHEIRMTE